MRKNTPKKLSKEQETLLDQGAERLAEIFIMQLDMQMAEKRRALSENPHNAKRGSANTPD